MANSSVCLDAFQTIVLPWLREHYVLPGAALVRMGNVHRSFLLCESASQYFGDWIVTRTSFGCIVHQVGPPCVAYRLYHADCLQRCFLRRISCSSKPPAITGSFAVSEYLRAKVRSRWVPNDIDTFIDDASLFWEYIRVYREMVLSPLGIKDHLYLSAAYNGPSLVLDVTGDDTVREIAAAASAATIVRVWPISSVWRAVTEWLDSYDASTSLSVGVLRAFRFNNDRHPKVVEQMPAEPIARATAIALALRERASGWRVAPRRLVAPAHPTAEGHRKWLSRSNAIRTHASHATGSSATRSHGLALAVVGSLGLRHSDNTAGSSNTIRQRGRAPTAVASLGLRHRHDAAGLHPALGAGGNLGFGLGLKPNLSLSLDDSLVMATGLGFAASPAVTQFGTRHHTLNTGFGATPYIGRRYVHRSQIPPSSEGPVLGQPIWSGPGWHEIALQKSGIAMLRQHLLRNHLADVVTLRCCDVLAHCFQDDAPRKSFTSDHHKTRSNQEPAHIRAQHVT